MYYNPADAEKLEKRASLLYPDSKEKLLDYDFEEALDMYDSAIKDKKDLKKLYKKIEKISTSKHSLLLLQNDTFNDNFLFLFLFIFKFLFTVFRFSGKYPNFINKLLPNSNLTLFEELFLVNKTFL